MAVAKRPPTRDNNTDREQLDVLNPATQTVIGQIPLTTAAEVSDAVRRARLAQKAWGALTVKERLNFIRVWRDMAWDRQDEGTKILRRENGKTDSSALAEFIGVDMIAQYYIHHAHNILKPQRRPTLFPIMQWAKVFHKPHGVVGIISPWNYPYLLPFIDMIPALIAGNTIVLKPSEITPFIAQWAVDLMYEAGIPRAVVQVIQGDGRSGAALVQEVDFVQFTGSAAVGRLVGQACVERLIPYSLELGGKDASIVLDDADPDKTAVGLIQGAFENAGQTCISIERVYVEAPIYDHLLKRIQHYAPQITFGLQDGLDVVAGSMTNQAELDRTIAHIQDAVAKGAKIIYGGNPRPDLGPLVHEPTILVDVDHTMTVMCEETFGPVLPIMKVQDVDEAVRLANDTVYGLSGTVFSRNLKRAQEIALQLDTGDVGVNRALHTIGTPSLLTGGQRESGMGRRNGPEGLLKYTASQSILLDNLMFSEDTLSLATPFIVRMVKLLRCIRRYVPFL